MGFWKRFWPRVLLTSERSFFLDSCFFLSAFSSESFCVEERIKKTCHANQIRNENCHNKLLQDEPAENQKRAKIERAGQVLSAILQSLGESCHLP